MPHKTLPIYMAMKSPEDETSMDVGYTSGSMFEFINIEFSDKYIYVTYRGQEFSNLVPQYTSVFVFDYQLNPIKMYTLDHEISSLFVDNDETMYAIKMSVLIPGVETKLLKYKLKR